MLQIVDSTSTSRVYFPMYFNGSELVVVGRLQNAGGITAGELLTNASTGITKYPIIIDPYRSHFVPGVGHKPSMIYFILHKACFQIFYQMTSLSFSILYILLLCKTYKKLY